MVNCTVTITQDTDTLEAGQRQSGQQASSTLFAGPAYLSAPSRAWQQAAALEGLIGGLLYVHTATDLNAATRVTVADNLRSGDYQVTAVAATGKEWQLTLQRRP